MKTDPRVLKPGGSHCVMINGGSDLTVSDVHIHHCIADGLYIDSTMGQVSERITVLNSRFLNNGRNNVSVIQARKVTFVSNHFNRGLYFAPWGSVVVEPNIHDLDMINKLSGNILFYDNRFSNRGLELNATKAATGEVYLRKFAYYFASGFPPVFTEELRLTFQPSLGECKAMPFKEAVGNFEDNFEQIAFGGGSFDIDDDGQQDINPCYGASFRLLQNNVTFTLPSGSPAPHSAEIRINGIANNYAVVIEDGLLVVDTRSLPNGHWKMNFIVKDVTGEIIPTALVPVIIANERPNFKPPPST